jgi:hypothetical protein
MNYQALSVVCMLCRHIQHYAEALRPPTDGGRRAKALAKWIKRTKGQRKRWHQPPDPYENDIALKVLNELSAQEHSKGPNE